MNKKSLIKAANKQDKMYDNLADLIEHTIYKQKKIGGRNEDTMISINGMLTQFVETQQAKARKLIAADISEF
jgi:hypothetical protein